MNQSKQKLVTT